MSSSKEINKNTLKNNYLVFLQFDYSLNIFLTEMKVIIYQYKISVPNNIPIFQRSIFSYFQQFYFNSFIPFNF